MTFMHVALECFIPSPAFDDVWSQCRSFCFESKSYVTGIAAKTSEGEIWREVRQIHAADNFRFGERQQCPHSSRPQRRNAAVMPSVYFGACGHAARGDADRQLRADHAYSAMIALVV